MLQFIKSKVIESFTIQRHKYRTVMHAQFCFLLEHRNVFIYLEIDFIVDILINWRLFINGHLFRHFHNISGINENYNAITI